MFRNYDYDYEHKLGHHGAEGSGGMGEEHHFSGDINDYNFYYTIADCSVSI